MRHSISEELASLFLRLHWNLLLGEGYRALFSCLRVMQEVAVAGVLIHELQFAAD